MSVSLRKFGVVGAMPEVKPFSRDEVYMLRGKTERYVMYVPKTLYDKDIGLV